MSDLSHPTTGSVPLVPIQAVFGLNAIGIALWFPRIPDVKAALGLDLFTLSLCLFFLPLGTLIGFLFSAQLIERAGRARVATWGNAVFLISFALPALAWSATSLSVALFLCGLSIASVEVGMNAKASEMEQAGGRRIMTKCHAFWSFGSVVGALTGGAFAQADISFLTQQLVMSPLFAAAAIWFGLQLVPDTASQQPVRKGFVLPSRVVLALCFLPVGALLLEGAMLEWSALFLRDWLAFDALTAAFILGAFNCAMGGMRLVGDRLVDAFSIRLILMMSAVFATVGIFLFSQSTSVLMATVSALLLGAGAANIYPLTVSVAGRETDQSAERNIAAVTFFAFSAFLIGPPLIGTLGSWLGLPMALALLTPAGLYPLILIWMRIVRV